MRNTRRSDVAPIQTPQRLNRLIDRSAEWPELSGTESKGSRGHLRSLRTFFHFFYFFQTHGIVRTARVLGPKLPVMRAI